VGLLLAGSFRNGKVPLLRAAPRLVANRGDVLITYWRVTRAHPRSPSNWVGAWGANHLGLRPSGNIRTRVFVSGGTRGGAATCRVRSGTLYDAVYRIIGRRTRSTAHCGLLPTFA
jgi:hypothetical protein